MVVDCGCLPVKLLRVIYEHYYRTIWKTCYISCRKAISTQTWWLCNTILNWWRPAMRPLRSNAISVVHVISKWTQTFRLETGMYWISGDISPTHSSLHIFAPLILGVYTLQTIQHQTGCFVVNYTRQSRSEHKVTQSRLRYGSQQIPNGHIYTEHDTNKHNRGIRRGSWRAVSPEGEARDGRAIESHSFIFIFFIVEKEREKKTEQNTIQTPTAMHDEVIRLIQFFIVSFTFFSVKMPSTQNLWYQTKRMTTNRISSRSV